MGNTRFVFAAVPDFSVPAGSAALSHLESQSMEDTRMDLSQLEESAGRSVAHEQPSRNKEILKADPIWKAMPTLNTICWARKILNPEKPISNLVLFLLPLLLQVLPSVSSQQQRKIKIPRSHLPKLPDRRHLHLNLLDCR